MTPPSIETSTRDERQAYVREKWECMHNCGRKPDDRLLLMSRYLEESLVIILLLNV